MTRWRSEYRRAHHAYDHDVLIQTWKHNFTERLQLRSDMMASHFDLGSHGDDCRCCSSSEGSDNDKLPPTKLRRKHLELTSPKKVVTFDKGAGFRAKKSQYENGEESLTLPVKYPDADIYGNKYFVDICRNTSSSACGNGAHAPSRVSATPAQADGRAVHAATSQPPPPAHTGSSSVDRAEGSVRRSAQTLSRRHPSPCSPPPQRRAASARHRQRSPSPFAAFGHAERGRDVGSQRTFNVSAPADEVHDSARAAAERRQEEERRSAAMDRLLAQRRPPPLPTGLWTTEYQRCFSAPVHRRLARMVPERPVRPRSRLQIF